SNSVFGFCIGFNLVAKTGVSDALLVDLPAIFEYRYRTHVLVIRFNMRKKAIEQLDIGRLRVDSLNHECKQGEKKCFFHLNSLGFIIKWTLPDNDNNEKQINHIREEYD